MIFFPESLFGSGTDDTSLSLMSIFQQRLSMQPSWRRPGLHFGLANFTFYVEHLDMGWLIFVHCLNTDLLLVSIGRALKTADDGLMAAVV